MAQSEGSIQTKLDLLSQVLDGKENFALVLIGSGIYRSTKNYEVHLRDDANRTLLNVSFVPGRTTRHHHTNSLLQLETTDGQVLVVAKGVAINWMHVWIGEEVIGRLDGSITGLKVLNTTDEVIFQIDNGICCGPSVCPCSVSCANEFSLTSNGVTLARVRKSYDGADVFLFNSRSLDSQTKALLILTATYLYVTEFAKSLCCGRIGSNGLSKRICWILIILVMAMLGTSLYYCTKY